MLNEALLDILFAQFEDVNEMNQRDKSSLDLNFAMRYFKDILDCDALIAGFRPQGQYEETSDDEEEEEEASEVEQKRIGQRQNLRINEPNLQNFNLSSDTDQNQHLRNYSQLRTFLRQIDLRNSLSSGQTNNTRQSQNVKYPVYAFSDFYYAASEDVKMIYDKVINDILYKYKKSKSFDSDYYDSLMQNFSVLTDQQIREHLQLNKDSEIILDSFKKQKCLKSLEKRLSLYTKLQNESKDNYTILCQEEIVENPYGVIQSFHNPLLTSKYFKELNDLINKKHKKIKLEEGINYRKEIQERMKNCVQNTTENNNNVYPLEENREFQQQIQIDQDPKKNQMELEAQIRQKDSENLKRFFTNKFKLFENEQQELFNAEVQNQKQQRILNKESFLYQCPQQDINALKCQGQTDEPGMGLMQRIQQQLEDEKKLNEQQNQQNQQPDESFKQAEIDKKEQEFQKALDNYSYYNKEIVEFCMGQKDNFLSKSFEAYNRVEIDMQNRQFFSEKLEVLLHQKKFPEKVGTQQQLANRLAAPSIVSRQKDNRSAVSHVNLLSVEDQQESYDLSQFEDGIQQQQDFNQQFGNEDGGNKELLNLIESKMKAFQTTPFYNHSQVAESFLLNDFSQVLTKHARYHRNNIVDNLYEEKREFLGLEREQVKYFDPWTTELVPLVNIKEQKKDNREILLEESTEKQNSHEYYKQVENLSLSKGNFILMEYIEQRPLLLNNTGMCSKVTRYVYPSRALLQFNQKRIKDEGDNYNNFQENSLQGTYRSTYGQMGQISNEEMTLWEFKNMLVEQLGNIGQIRFLDKNGTIPLQGQLTDERFIGIAVIENELYRAPIFKQKLPATDFLLVRTRVDNCHYKYTLRPIDCIYLVGQIEPKVEIFTPHSRPLGTFLKNCLKTYIKKQFKMDQEVKQDELEQIFQKQSHTNIRSALKECKGIQDSSNQKTWRHQRGSNDDIQVLKYDITANQVCLYESMLHSSYLLQEFGLKELKNSDKMKKTLQEYLSRNPQDFNSWVIARRIEDELNMTAWSLSQSFLHSANQTGRMLLYGIGDPTSGHGGLNYIKKPLKARGEKGQNAIQEKKPQVMGTENDLRKLHVEDIQNISRKLGLTTEPNLKRWRMINKLTAFLQQSQNPDDKESRDAVMFRKNLELLDEKQRKQLNVIEKYAKNQRQTTKKQKEQYQKELDKQLAKLIQNLTIKVQGKYFEDFEEVKKKRTKRDLDKDDKNKDLEYNDEDIKPFLIVDQENYKLRIEAFQKKEKKIWLEKKKKKGLQ
ncbi:unnamed protein product (macronuclear) [Paramecium tetraurelia]|uniref:Transcription initiation factor TFIID subunit 1 histone acetyltransferase domain-containing protein n=1 Tax=Paramecium tetraurelia TaxID=5888 RepID=A0D5W6_PARTE|nr:uncharacterized protein GSPATT00013863001 [Paramecium tetraurelia]CAK78433.1 unnamed protein product [Paramecium tetraurelia]|eukprot:XP_001445830.1 hypothetical protein (macronuclear) [Paramecium tetraurelia strain d4-2]